MAAAAVFIENNGYKLTAEPGEVEKVALWITQEKPDIVRIAQWFKQWSKKQKS